MKIPDHVAYKCFTLAQFLAPFDTGNLKYNAMDLNITNTGFMISYNSPMAYYIETLEEGYVSKKHKGFISKRTVPQVGMLIRAIYNGTDQFTQNYANLVTSESMQNMEARNERNIDSIVQNNYIDRYY